MMAVVPDDQAPIGELRNLGPRATAWLMAVGIETVGEARSLGAVGCWRAVRASGVPVTRNLVWAVEGGLQGVDWRSLPRERRRALEKRMDAQTES